MIEMEKLTVKTRRKADLTNQKKHFIMKIYSDERMEINLKLNTG
jgi:hypothetical protein